MNIKNKLMAMGVVMSLFLPLSQAFALADVQGNKNQTAIEYLYNTGVITGYPDGSFKPNNTVNRAELLKILVGGKKITPTVQEYNNCFPDVKDEWFAPYVCYAKQQGWVGGYPDGNFKPAQTVNKVEALKMLVNSQGYVMPSIVDELIYSDVDNSQWYAPFIKVAKDKGLLEISIGNYGTSSEMTRGEISENIYRAIIVNLNALNSFADYQTTSDADNDLLTVTSVVDGDTIKVKIDGEVQTLRLIGMDTPETVSPQDPVQCFGLEASNMAKSKLLNKKVRLEADSTQGDKDKYGRLLRYVFLEDGTNFNQWMISNGYAFEYTYNVPYKYQSEFKAAEQAAMETEAGLWAENTCNGVPSPVDTDSNDNQSGDYKFYVSSKAKTKYYCETDPAWQELSATNLLIYESEEELEADFPTLTLNKPC